MGLKLYLITQTENNGINTYDSAVVAADNEDVAKLINPDGSGKWGKRHSAWCASHNLVTAKLIGEASECVGFGVVLASFNAGLLAGC